MEYPCESGAAQKMLGRIGNSVAVGSATHMKLENAIATAGKQAVLTRFFLSKHTKMLHLWHMIHRPLVILLPPASFT